MNELAQAEKNGANEDVKKRGKTVYLDAKVGLEQVFRLWTKI